MEVVMTGGQARRESDWSEDRLRRWLTTFYSGQSIVVLANREPVRHDRTPDGGVVASRSSGGLVTALEPLMRACAGTWVAHGSGSADRTTVDRRDGLDVPPANPRYRLRRVWLDAGEERRYYCGFANEGLWPLCHRAQVQPVFRSADFDTYAAVNARFAEAVCAEADSDRPLILVQDYHFALAPRIISQHLPHATIVGFWHIPWPQPRDFAICPWGRQLLEGLLGNTILGFQTPDDCHNFVDCVAALLDVSVNSARDTITRHGRRTEVHDYPVSINWDNPSVRDASVDTCRTTVRRQLGIAPGIPLVVGIDRLDYTKGIVEKFLAVERLLETHPEMQGRFVLAQIAEPSRECLAAYRDIRSRVVAAAERINLRFGTGTYQPIVLLEAHYDAADVYRFLRAADVCYVGSLHDGMNLVAKEFACARDDGHGVLMLSEFAGASRELTTALIVHPFAIDACARTLARALTMPAEEQAWRMRAMRSIVSRWNTYRWAGALLADATRLRRAAVPAARAS